MGCGGSKNKGKEEIVEPVEKSSKDKKVENEAEEEEFKIKVGEDLEELVLKRDKMDKLFSPQMMNCLNQHDIKYIYIPHLEPSHSYQILHSYLTEQTIDITLLSIGEAIFLGIFSPRIENDAEEFIGLNFEAMKKEIEKDFNEKRSYIHPDIGDKEEKWSMTINGEDQTIIKEKDFYIMKSSVLQNSMKSINVNKRSFDLSLPEIELLKLNKLNEYESFKESEMWKEIELGCRTIEEYLKMGNIQINYENYKICLSLGLKYKLKGLINLCEIYKEHKLLIIEDIVVNDPPFNQPSNNIPASDINIYPHKDITPEETKQSAEPEENITEQDDDIRDKEGGMDNSRDSEVADRVEDGKLSGEYVVRGGENVDIGDNVKDEEEVGGVTEEGALNPIQVTETEEDKEDIGQKVNIERNEDEEEDPKGQIISSIHDSNNFGQENAEENDSSHHEHTQSLHSDLPQNVPSGEENLEESKEYVKSEMKGYIEEIRGSGVNGEEADDRRIIQEEDLEGHTKSMIQDSNKLTQKSVEDDSSLDQFSIKDNSTPTQSIPPQPQNIPNNSHIIAQPLPENISKNSDIITEPDLAENIPKNSEITENIPKNSEITEPDVAENIPTNSEITEPEIAENIQKNGEITEPDVAEIIPKNNEIITEPDVAEIIPKNNEIITEPDVAEKNSEITETDLAGNIPKNGEITEPVAENISRGEEDEEEESKGNDVIPISGAVNTVEEVGKPPPKVESNMKRECKKGHKMKLGVNHYDENNFKCDQCKSSNPYYIEWYHCKECGYDLCLNCCPPPPISIIPSLKPPKDLNTHHKNATGPTSSSKKGELKGFKRGTEAACIRKHKMLLGSGHDINREAKCNECKIKLGKYSINLEWYCCKICKYDLCLKCADLNMEVHGGYPGDICQLKIGEKYEINIKRDELKNLLEARTHETFRWMDTHSIEVLDLPYLDAENSYTILNQYILNKDTMQISLPNLSEAVFLGIIFPKIGEKANEFVAINSQEINKEIERNSEEKNSYIHPNLKNVSEWSMSINEGILKEIKGREFNLISSSKLEKSIRNVDEKNNNLDLYLPELKGLNMNNWLDYESFKECEIYKKLDAGYSTLIQYLWCEDIQIIPLNYQFCLSFGLKYSLESLLKRYANYLKQDLFTKKGEHDGTAKINESKNKDLSLKPTIKTEKTDEVDGKGKVRETKRVKNTNKFSDTANAPTLPLASIGAGADDPTVPLARIGGGADDPTLPMPKIGEAVNKRGLKYEGPLVHDHSKCSKIFCNKCKEEVCVDCHIYSYSGDSDHIVALEDIMKKLVKTHPKTDDPAKCPGFYPNTNVLDLMHGNVEIDPRPIYLAVKDGYLMKILTVNLETGGELVLKQITVANTEDADEILEQAMLEYQLMEQFKEYCIRSYNFGRNEGSFEMLMENWGASFSKIYFGQFDERTFFQIIRRCSQVLAKLQLKNIFHGDIKTDNLLLNEVCHEPKFIDFGISVEVKDSRELIEEFTANDSTKPIKYVTGLTHHMAPPELLQYCEYGKEITYSLSKIDTFCLGLTYCAMIDKNIFSDKNLLHLENLRMNPDTQHLFLGELEGLLKECLFEINWAPKFKGQIQEIILSCCQIDLNLRPDAFQLFALFQSFDSSKASFEEFSPIMDNLKGEKLASLVDANKEIKEYLEEVNKLGKDDKYKAAERPIELAKLKQQKIFGNMNCMEYADIYTTYGIVYNGMKNYQKAITMHQMALGQREKIFGKKAHPDMAAEYDKLGTLRMAQNSLAEAEKMYQLSMDQSVKIFGNKPHPDIALSYMNLGKVYMKKKMVNKAEEMFNLSLNQYKQIFGDKPDWMYARIYSILAGFYREQGEGEKAEEMYKISIRQRTEINGEKPHNDIAGTYYNLALLYLSQNEYCKAIEAVNISLKQYIEMNGTKPHIRVADIYNFQGIVYEREGKLEESIKWRTRGLEMIFKGRKLDMEYTAIDQRTEALFSLQKKLLKTIDQNLIIAFDKYKYYYIQWGKTNRSTKTAKQQFENHISKLNNYEKLEERAAMCEKCQGNIPMTSQRHNCKSCNYNICLNCSPIEPKPKTEESLHCLSGHNLVIGSSHDQILELCIILPEFKNAWEDGGSKKYIESLEKYFRSGNQCDGNVMQMAKLALEKR